MVKLEVHWKSIKLENYMKILVLRYEQSNSKYKMIKKKLTGDKDEKRL